MARPERKLRSVKERQDRYLRDRALIGTLSHASRAARVSSNTVYEWRETDQEGGYAAEEFRRLERAAIDAFADRLEHEALRRAVVGVRKGKYYQDKRIAWEREYSDSMLAMLLNGARPEKFRQRHEVTGTVDHKHNHQLDLSRLTPDQLRQLDALMEAATGDGQHPDEGERGEPSLPS